MALTDRTTRYSHSNVRPGPPQLYRARRPRAIGKYKVPDSGPPVGGGSVTLGVLDGTGVVAPPVTWPVGVAVTGRVGVAVSVGVPPVAVAAGVIVAGSSDSIAANAFTRENLRPVAGCTASSPVSVSSRSSWVGRILGFSS